MTAASLADALVTMASRRHGQARDQLAAITAAHTALTAEVVCVAELTAAHGYPAFAAHLDQHRAELNVVIGEFAIWAESFGEWAAVDPGSAIFPPAVLEPRALSPTKERDTELRRAADALRARRTGVLATLANAREALRGAEIPVDHLTAYRRQIRLWAGEAVELVTEAHRLALADRYLRRLHHGSATAVLREWMQELDEAERESELSLAAACGYGDVVERYRVEATGA